MPPAADALRPHRILISFHYARNKDLGEEGKRWWPHFPVRIFGDSGAYSAASLGKPISVDEYGEWLKVNERHLTVYANLDVINDAEASARNLAALERKGFRPLPVYHLGSDIKALERIIDAGYPYIALGGCVGKPAPLLMRFAVQCFKLARAKGRGTVFHGFGLTNLPCIMNLPWFSVDSSSWTQAMKFATVKLFDPSKANFVTCRLFTEDVDKHARLLRTYGGDPERLRTRSKYNASNDIAGVSALSWRALEAWCRRRHGPIVLPSDASDHGGLHLYQVTQPQECRRAEAVSKSLADASGMHLYQAVSLSGNGRAPTAHLADDAGVHAYMASQGNVQTEGANRGLHLYMASTAMPDVHAANTRIAGSEADVSPSGRKRRGRS